MAGEAKMDGPDDQFPVGMRVLAVDDNPTCLRLLEAALRKCQYNVTTTSKAITAQKLLREKDSKFDLVISDVHNTPDMGGFQLLEYVGLEMDLPVIMLSADEDPNMILKGINHGACGYLLKPVRLQEVRNIWQHVYRRRIAHQEELKTSPTGHIAEPSQEKVSKKRKDGDGEDDDNKQLQQDEDTLRTKKRTRLNWSPELHRKFIAAVNHLGIEKAVPKKILELMDDETITREHVASHLQKYRQSLRRLSKMANEQARAALLASCNSSYAQTGLSGGAGSGNLHRFSGPGKPGGRAHSSNFSNNSVFGHGVDISANFSGALSSLPCVARNQDWSCHSPICGACSGVWSSAGQLTQDHSNPFLPIESSGQACLALSFSFQENSSTTTLPLPAGGELGESHRQAAQIDRILQDSLAFIGEPRAEAPLLPPPRDGEFQPSVNDQDMESKDALLPDQESLNYGSLEDLVNFMMKRQEDRSH